MAEKYQRWHDQIIRRARSRSLDCYSEWHHIVPRSLGGSDDKSNLVQLTYREHFLVHWLLTRIFGGRARVKMLYALHCMTWRLDGCRTVSGWQFDVAKRLLKQEALRRLEERRKRARKSKVDGLIGLSLRAQEAVGRSAGLTVRRAEDRWRLRHLASDMLKGSASSLNTLRYKQVRRKKGSRLGSSHREQLQQDRKKAKRKPFDTPTWLKKQAESLAE